MRGLFVSGTDTGVGKSVLSAALLAAILDGGEEATAYKPVLTGTDEPPQGAWPADHELLASVSGQSADEVAPRRYGPAVSPHLAAELAGSPIEAQALLSEARAAAGRAGQGVLVVEGVGGLLVPLAEGYAVRDLACDLGLGIVLAARPGLGTINHTLLTLESARAVGLHVHAVVLTPWPASPTPMELSNRETIARLGGVEVHGLKTIVTPERTSLARAGGTLPWRYWLSGA